MVQKAPRWEEQGAWHAEERQSRVKALSELHRVAQGATKQMVNDCILPIRCLYSAELSLGAQRFPPSSSSATSAELAHCSRNTC